MASHLCDGCKTIMPALKPLSHTIRDRIPKSAWKKTKHSFYGGSKEDCHLCVIILSSLSPQERLAIQKYQVENKEVECIVGFLVFLTASETSAIMKMSAVFTAKEKHVEAVNPIEIYFDLSPWTPLQSRQPSTEAAERRTDSNTTLKVIQDWIHECDTQHPACKPSFSEIDSLWVPSLLIFVGSSATPALHLCKDTPRGSKYTSLSHCWGGYMPLRLLRSNLESFKQQITFSTLPATFRDAITVTRQLDIQYLWIDSLCIVQDSADDWARESLLMYQVYSNAAFNIAAAFARDGRDGLFSERHPLSVQHCIFEVDWMASVKGDSTNGEDVKLAGKQEANRLYEVIPDRAWEQKIEESPLSQRGWVCQERLLSRRNLHYADGQVYWECAEKCASELFPTGIYNVKPSKATKIKEAANLQNKTKSSKSNILAQAKNTKNLDAWRQIIAHYTACYLTYESDKLPGISGLAKYWQELWGSEVKYLAGMWNVDLPYQLLWRPIQPRPHLTKLMYTWNRPKVYKAPTWSWASINGPVHILEDPVSMLNDNVKVMIKVNDVRIDYASSSEFGQVKGGQLSVSCRLARVVIVSEPGDQLDVFEGLKLDLECLISVERATVWMDNYDVKRNTSGIFRDIFFMPITKESHSKTASWNTELQGILLQEVPGRKGTFQRFGFCIVFQEVAHLFYEAFDFFDVHAEDLLERSRSATNEILYNIKII